MPLRFGQLGLWFLATYYVVLRLRIFLRDGGWERFLHSFDDLHHVTLQFTGLLSFATFSFGAYYLLWRTYGRIGRGRLVVFFFLLTVSCMLFRAALEEGLLYAIFGENNYNPNTSWPAYLLDNLYYATVFLPVGIVFFFVQYGRHTDAVRYRLETSYREAELKFLRSQINPHFLFNTINNVYALVSTEDPNALPALDKLSGLLRYSLYAQDETVPIDREWSYLQDLIHLESLRIPNWASPDISVDPMPQDWQIPPLLLVPLVENAFKHGQLDRPDRPLRIKLAANEGSLHFTVVNPVRDKDCRMDTVGGIGLNNVRKRLNLLYPERHTLEAGQTDGLFRVHLTIKRRAA